MSERRRRLVEGPSFVTAFLAMALTMLGTTGLASCGLKERKIQARANGGRHGCRREKPPHSATPACPPRSSRRPARNYSPPGAGGPCAGTGNGARVRAGYESWWAGQLAKVVVAELDQLLGHIERARSEQVCELNFHTEDLEALRAATVAERESNIRFDFPMTFDRDLDPAKMLAPVIAAVSRNP